MKRPNGYVVYEGPSALNGEPIVAIVTGFKRPSANDKTGPMLQLWILRQDSHPCDAIASGLDEAICGDCPLRGKVCYVNAGQAPAQVWKAWAEEKYPSLAPSEFGLVMKRHQIRFGAYGDPLAIPLPILESLESACDDHSGYTHQWQRVAPETERRGRFQRLVMASVESERDALNAQARGWRTFRVKSPHARRLPNEKPCPAGPKASRVQCYDCPLKCNGGDGVNVVTDAHGAGASGLDSIARGGEA